jgi:Spy/CpxP family protein refolding chaperone
MKTLKISLIMLTLVQLVNAQQKPMQGDRKEKFESMKIGFITQRLDLTPEEAQKFWPLYNKYSDELEKLRKDRMNNLMNTRDNFDNMSDADIEKAVDNEIAFRSADVDIMKKYNPQFKKVLPIRKVAKLYKAEEEFKRKLVEMIRERRGEQHRQGSQNGPPPQGGPEDKRDDSPDEK